MSFKKSIQLFNLTPPFLTPFDDDELTLTLTHPFHQLDPFTMDLLQIHESTSPFYSFTSKRVITQTRKPTPSELYLKSISDRVESLESKFDHLLAIKEKKEKEKEKAKAKAKIKQSDRKYSWTAEIKGAEERKYKWTAEIEGDDVKKGKKGERKYQWSTEIKGKDDDHKQIYTWKATVGGDKKEEKKDKGKKVKKDAPTPRIVEIEDEDSAADDHRGLVLRKAYAKRAAQRKGKNKELSPWDAAALIQMSFRAYLIRRSQALRAIRELAVAKTKLKELRASFNNFSYRSRISRDAEERQKFSEKIIVLLLTVDAIEGVDTMVRAAKRSMVDELEAMLDVVDPQQPGRSLSMRRRTFDMPSGTIQKEIAEGVAQVVQMLEEDNATFEE